MRNAEMLETHVAGAAIVHYRLSLSQIESSRAAVSSV